MTLKLRIGFMGRSRVQCYALNGCPFKAKRPALLLQQRFPVKVLAFEDDFRDTFERSDVVERVAVHEDEVRLIPRANRTHTVV